MATNSPQPKEHDCAFSALDTLIQILDIAKVACVFPPAQAAISSTSALLTMIKVRSLRLFHRKFLIRDRPGLRGQ